MTRQEKTRDIFNVVNDLLIKQLESGIIPWKQLWNESGPPRNLITERHYRGINVWLLSMLHYEHNLFLTHNQVNQLGGVIKTGQTGHLAVFWKWKEEDSETPVVNNCKNRRIPYLSAYRLFNVAQCGLPEELFPLEEAQVKQHPLKLCEEILEGMPNRPRIRHLGDAGYYHPHFDLINMPPKEHYLNPECYYSQLFQQLVHSTAHPKRLNRKAGENLQPDYFGPYSIEQLVGDMGRSYLISRAGIEACEYYNRLTYCKEWIAQAKADKQCLVYAALEAQRAVDYIVGRTRFNSYDALIAEELYLKSVTV